MAEKPKRSKDTAAQGSKATKAQRQAAAAADQKQQAAAKAPKQEAQKPAAKGAGTAHKVAIAAIVIIIVAAAAYLIYQYVNNSVPFPTFKTTLLTAPKVAVTVSGNITQLTSMYSCSAAILGSLAKEGRNLSTINYFVINQDNMSCTYQSGPLGHISLQTTNASYCTGIANNEPGIFLNYSSTGNYTRTTLSHFYVYGDARYYALNESGCSVVVELS